MPSAPLTILSLFKYGFMALPLSFVGLPLYVHVPEYYSVHYGISLGVIGFVLLIVRGLDAIQDPWLGHIAQRFAKQRIPLMAVSSMGLVASFYALFHPPVMSSTGLIVWFGAMLFIATFCFSFLTIVLAALGALWREDYHEKTRIASVREGLGLIGLLLAASLPVVLQNSMDAATAFTYMATILSLLLFVSYVVFVQWYHSEKIQGASEIISVHQLSLWQQIKRTPSSIRQFYLAYGSSMIGSSIPAVLVLFYIRDVIKAPEKAGACLAVYFLSAIFAMPLWNYLAKFYSKTSLWISAMALAATSFLSVMTFGAGDIELYLFVCVITGALLGAELIFPPSILADEVQNHGAESQAFLQFGILNFLSKLALALASALALFLLDIGGYEPQKITTEGTQYLLVGLYGLAPVFFKLTAIFVLLKFLKYTKGDEHESMDKNPNFRRTNHA